MANTAAFGLAASSFSSVPAGQGYIDFVVVSSTDSSAPGGFVSLCNAQKASPILQNSDSGSGGCSGNCSSYYAGLKSSGLMGAGGESEGLSEVQAILATSNFVFFNYGGEGTGGPTGNNNIWASTGGHTNGGGGATISKGQLCATWMETYTTDSMLPASEMGTEAGYNHDAGCFEVGLLVGSWAANDYGASASTYEEMYDEIKSAIGACAGFQYWYVGGDGAGGAGSSVMTDLLGAYTHDTRNIMARAGGAPGPAPGPTPAPTPGTAPNVYINVRQRLYQAGID